jgi:hypothetical protein
VNPSICVNLMGSIGIADKVMLRLAEDETGNAIRQTCQRGEVGDVVVWHNKPISVLIREHILGVVLPRLVNGLLDCLRSYRVQIRTIIQIEGCSQIQA